MRIKAYTSEQAATNDGHWLKALGGVSDSIRYCVDNSIPVRNKAQSEGIDSAGGFVVPTTMDTAIVRVLEQQSAFQSNAELRIATSDSMIRPRRTGGVTASWLLPEGSAIPESSFSLDLLEATAHKIGVLIRTSSELYEDSAADFAEFVAQEIAYAFSGAIDDAGFNGDGTSTYSGFTGVFNRLKSGFLGRVAAASGHKSWSTVDSSDLSSAMGNVNGSALPNAKWYCSSSCYAELFCRLGQNSGSLIASNGPNGIEASYCGYPIVISNKLLQAASTDDNNGKPFLLFGDLRQAAMLVQRRPIQLATSLQRAFDQDEVLIRGTARYSVLVHDCGSATQRGPVACLIGTS